MCQICVEYQKGLLTWDEAMKNSIELIEEDHYQEVIEMLLNDIGEDE